MSILGRYLNKLGHDLAVFDDIKVQKLSVELKILEQCIEVLHQQRDDMMYIIEQFQYKYQLELGSIISGILNLRCNIQSAHMQQQRIFFEKTQQDYRENLQKQELLKTKRQKLEKSLELLDPFANELAYETIEEELEKLQEQIKRQQQKLKQTRSKIKQVKIKFEESPETKAYQEAEEEYEEFKQTYDEVLEEERFELKIDEEKELKKLYKKAAKLCHPDTVTDNFKKQATEIMQQLNEARKLGDIKSVLKILDKLSNGFDFTSDKLAGKEQIQAKIDELIDMRQSLEFEIRELEQGDVWTDMPSKDSWNEYFAGLKHQLKIELERLQNELDQIS